MATKKAKAATPAALPVGTIQLHPKHPGYTSKNGGAYYQFLLTQVGSTPAQFIAAAKAAPPFLGTKGQYAGKAHPPKGWLTWLTVPSSKNSFNPAAYVVQPPVAGK